MKQTKWLLGATIGALFAAPAMAQSALDFERRDLFQEQRILQGVQSGSLTAQEAARLQNGTQRIDRMESRALSDGRLDSRERARIDSAQDRLGQQIRRESSDRQTANPNSPESRRIQEQMQREVRSDHRQLQGMRDGSYSNREVARQESRDAGNRQFGWRGDRFNNARDNSFNQGRGDQIRGDATRQFPGRGDHVRGETQRPAAAVVQDRARPAVTQRTERTGQRPERTGVTQRTERTVVATRQTTTAGQTRAQGNWGGRR